MSLLLDTNVVSEFMKPRPDAAVVEWLRLQDEDALFLSTLTLAELHRGIALLPAGKKRTALAEWVEGELSERFEGRILPVDRTVSRVWGELMASAERRGRRLAAMDGLIAATAMSSQLDLVTRNVRDFEAVDVTLVNPWE